MPVPLIVLSISLVVALLTGVTLCVGALVRQILDASPRLCSFFRRN